MKFWLAWAVLVGLEAADAVLTAHALPLGARELNPIVGAVVPFGLPGIAMLKAGPLAVLGCCGALKATDWRTAGVPALIYVGVVIYQLWGMWA